MTKKLIIICIFILTISSVCFAAYPLESAKEVISKYYNVSEQTRNILASNLKKFLDERSAEFQDVIFIGDKNHIYGIYNDDSTSTRKIIAEISGEETIFGVGGYNAGGTPKITLYSRTGKYQYIIDIDKETGKITQTENIIYSKTEDSVIIDKNKIKKNYGTIKIENMYFPKYYSTPASNDWATGYNNMYYSTSYVIEDLNRKYIIDTIYIIDESMFIKEYRNNETYQEPDKDITQEQLEELQNIGVQIEAVNTNITNSNNTITNSIDNIYSGITAQGQQIIAKQEETTQAVNKLKEELFASGEVGSGEFANAFPEINIEDQTANFFSTILEEINGIMTTNSNKTISMNLLGKDTAISSDFFVIDGPVKILVTGLVMYNLGILVILDLRKTIMTIRSGNIEKIADNDVQANLL